MNLNRIGLLASLVAPLTLASLGTSAAEQHEQEHEHRQHAAHVHGIATLNLVREGDEVHVELESPAANIIGFEHVPSSEADHAALDRAVAALKDGEGLFRFNAEARCRMEKATVESALLEEEHAEHAGEHKGDHGHEKHGHDEHGHAGLEHDDATHSDIGAVYHFECDRPDKLTELSVELFEAFPATEKLNVQYVIDSKQGAAELTPARHVAKF